MVSSETNNLNTPYRGFMTQPNNGKSGSCAVNTKRMQPAVQENYDCRAFIQNGREEFVRATEIYDIRKI